MRDDFNIDNAVAITDSTQGTQSVPESKDTFSIENAIPVDAPHSGETSYDAFKATAPSQEESIGTDSNTAFKTTSSPKEGQTKDTSPEAKPKPSNNRGDNIESVHQSFSYPFDKDLNAIVDSAVGASWNTFVKSITGKDDKYVDAYLNHINKEHPIATVVGGSAPFIASAAVFPEALLPNIWGRTAIQFGSVGFLNALGQVRTEEGKRSAIEKAGSVAVETAKQTAAAPIFAKAQLLKIAERPFATALAQSGVIAGGVGVMNTFFGDNVVEAFKQGGAIGVVNLAFHSPALLKTAIGRGSAAKISQESGVKIDPDAAPEVVQKQINEASDSIQKTIPTVDQPHIIAATVKLGDGTEIHGTSHNDALSKIGLNENISRDIKLKDVSLKPQENTGYKDIISKEGQNVGKLAYGKNMAEEAFHIDINPDFKGQQYGPSAIAKVLKEEGSIQGDVGKNNIKAQEFWKDMGAKLVENKSGNFSMYLSKEDFFKNKHQSGFTVLNPDGTTKFITREESKQAPYNLKNGDSSEVKGLNESKFLSKDPELRIVNPETIRMMNEKGGMNVDLIPGVAEAAEVLQKSHAELKEKFTPPEVGKEAQFTAATIRENLGVLARSHDQLEQALLSAKKIFDKANKESSLDFVYNMEEGKAQSTPELEKVARTLRNILDTKRDEIRNLGTGKLENFIENYFPHVWESPNKASNVIKSIMGRRPFEGPKSFLKKRTIPTTREGVELGLKPVSYNPIDSVMLKVREMDRYLMAQRSILALKDQGLIKFVRPGGEIPEGFVKIDDRFADVVSKNEAGEVVIRGKYMAQRDAARILNNYLSPGLAGKSYIYDLYRGAGNNMNQFQLGLSAFHLGFTSMDATISKFALGLNKLSGGDFAGAIKEFGKTPFAPITNILQGRQLLQAWYGKDQGELTNLIASYMASAGGRAKMDKFYSTGMHESMKKAIKEGKLATAALKVPFYIVEQVARPIMEYIVPRQKMGVFMDLMKMEIERNPNISHEQLRGIAQKAWDSVDNRMGQLVYDNLFWNKTVKDLGMASVRSLGWNLGTIREIGGGAQDVIGNVNDIIHGKGTKLSYKTAYVMALPIVTGLYGAIYQYLHTGQGPQEIKDYFFPKTGAIDNKGQEARISFPTYMKDLYHYKTNFIQTAINKFSPVNNTVMEMMANKDFYGTEIRNVDDPIMRQVIDEAKFLGTQFIPFGFRNQNRDTRTSLGSKVEPFIGLTPAPHDINMTRAEREAADLAHAKIPVGSRTKEEAAHSQAKSQLRSQYMASRDPAILNDGVSQGVISAKEKRQIIKQSQMSNLERLTQHLTFEEVEHVMKKATEEEKSELQKILEKKRKGKMQRGTWSDSEEALYAKSLEPKE